MALLFELRFVFFSLRFVPSSLLHRLLQLVVEPGICPVEVHSYEGDLVAALCRHFLQCTLTLVQEDLALLFVPLFDASTLLCQGLRELGLVILDNGRVLVDNLARHVGLQLRDQLLLLCLESTELHLVFFADSSHRLKSGEPGELRDLFVKLRKLRRLLTGSEGVSDLAWLHGDSVSLVYNIEREVVDIPPFRDKVSV